MTASRLAVVAAALALVLALPFGVAAGDPAARPRQVTAWTPQDNRVRIPGGSRVLKGPVTVQASGHGIFRTSYLP